VQRDSFEQVYSTKTDDELLALAADEASLRDDAKPILVHELRRRKLAEASRANTSEIQSAPTSHKVSRALSWAKWLGLWLLNTFTATLGVALSIGIVTYSSQPFVSRGTRMRFMEQFVYTHHYPLPIFVGLVFGFFSYVHFRGSYRYWVWILPTAGVLFSVMNWKQSNQTSWSQSLLHFFGYIPFPDNRDQLDSTLFLYMSLAYSTGVLVHKFVQHKLPASWRTS
jgi:hypothetical protein